MVINPKIEKVQLGEPSSKFGAAASTLGGKCPECGKLYALVGRVHKCDLGFSVPSAERTDLASGGKETVSARSAPSVGRSSKFDRNLYHRGYMKEYMRNYRKRKRNAKSSD